MVTDAHPGRMARALDPVTRATEVLFGLIMVLTFTAALNTSEAGRSDVRLMLIAALGCNLAWGLIDAAMYLLTLRAEKALGRAALNAVRQAADPAQAHRQIAAALPPLVAAALGPEELERIRLHLLAQNPPATGTGPGPGDLLAAGLVFALVFVATLPVVVPFLLLEEPRRALFLSHAIAIALLFLAGASLGRHWGRPWRVGLAMVALGLAMVGVALVLGG